MKKKLNYTNTNNIILSKLCHCSSKSVMSLFQQHATQFTPKRTLTIFHNLRIRCLK